VAEVGVAMFIIIIIMILMKMWLRCDD